MKTRRLKASATMVVILDILDGSGFVLLTNANNVDLKEINDLIKQNIAEN